MALLSFCVLPEPSAQAEELRHEFTGSITLDTGTSNREAPVSAGEEEAEPVDTDETAAPDTTKFTTTGAVLEYGYIYANGLEPKIELGYANRKLTVGELETSERVLDVGFGLLFNFPLTPKAPPPRVRDNNEDNNDEDDDDDEFECPRVEPFSLRFVPFTGLMMVKTSRGKSVTMAETFSLTNNEMVNKLVFGLRTMIAPNVSLNTSVRLFYERSAFTSGDDATVTNANGLMIETRLLSISVLL